MNRLKQQSILVLILATFSLQFAGCDFQEATDSFDDFDIIIGLDPINTVVNGIFYDNATGNLMDVQLSFSGNGASSLIDAYSDPFGSNNSVDGGLISFGLRNSVVPSSSNPFEFNVTVSADGFYAQTKTVRVTNLGSASFEVGLVREVDTFTQIQGTSAVQNGAVQASSAGVVQQTVTVQTQAPSPVVAQAQATLTIAAGTTPVTSSGQPLSGSIQTQIRVYDPSQGQTNLPTGATSGGSGTNQAIAAAVFFKMTDASGNSAANFTSSSGKMKVSSKRGDCSLAGGFFEIELDITDPNIVSAFNVIVATNGSPSADIFGYTPDDNQNNSLGSSPLSSDGSTVSGSICVGGTLANVNLSLLGSASQGVFFTLVLPSSFGSTGSLNQMITIANAGAASAASITLEGPGVFGFRNVTVAAGSVQKSIGDWLGLTGSYFILAGGTFTFSVELDDGTQQSVVTSDPTSGAGSINLPATTGLTTYSIDASMECGPGQEFEVQVTSESLDAVSVFYKRNAAGALWRAVPDAAITNKTASNAQILVEGTLSLLPNTSYVFRGVLADNSAEKTQTTPTSGSNWLIELNANDVGFDCVAS